MSWQANSATVSAQSKMLCFPPEITLKVRKQKDLHKTSTPIQLYRGIGVDEVTAIDTEVGTTAGAGAHQGDVASTSLSVADLGGFGRTPLWSLLFVTKRLAGTEQSTQPLMLAVTAPLPSECSLAPK
jgi:hypothetical protein